MARTPIAPKVRWQVLARDGFRCRYCGVPGGAAVLVVDHASPVSRGGENTINNLVTACETCNQGKSNVEFPGLHVINVYFDLGDRVIGWLGAAWRDEAGVDWEPDQDLLLQCLMVADDYAWAEMTVREFAAHIRNGDIDWHETTWHSINSAFEVYLADITRMSHPSLEEMPMEEIKATFWRNLDKWIR